MHTTIRKYKTKVSSCTECPAFIKEDYSNRDFCGAIEVKPEYFYFDKTKSREWNRRRVFENLCPLPKIQGEI